MTEQEIKEKHSEFVSLEHEIEMRKLAYNDQNAETRELIKQLLQVEPELLSDYYDCIRTYLKSAKNWKNKHLKYNTKTINMMTDLRSGYYTQEEYCIKNGKYVSLGEKDYKLDFYVINNFYVLVSDDQLGRLVCPPIDKEYTATEFKKIGHLDSKSLMTDSQDMIVELNNGQKICLYKKPVQLNAQTNYDMDYRKEWEYGSLTYLGNEYGDTSTFYFVGQLVW